MNYRERCRQRIKSRRSYTSYNRDQNHLVRSLYSLVILFLLGSTLVLGNLIYEKNGFEVLASNIQKIIEPLQAYRISNFIPFENWFNFDEDTITTSLVSHYHDLGNQYFEATNNQVVSVDDGVVLYVATQATGNLVLIKHDNGIMATYGAMSDVHVDEDDRILKGQILGLTNGAVYMDFSDNGTTISFSDVIIK